MARWRELTARGARGGDEQLDPPLLTSCSGPPRPSGPCPAKGSPAQALSASQAMGAMPAACAAAALPAPARFCSEEGSRLVWRFWQHRLGLLS